LFERNDKLDEALDDLKKVLEIDKSYVEAAYNAQVRQLPNLCRKLLTLFSFYLCP